MFKQLLAFVLTAALIVETPATAYAAEQTPISGGGGVESVQDLTEEDDETDTSAQDGTEIGDTGDSILEEDAGDSSADADTETEDSDETDAADETDATDAADETDETGNTADEDAVESIEVNAVQMAVEPLAIAESVKLVPSGDGVSAAAYSFNDTFTVVRGDGVDGEADLADSYTLKMTLDDKELKYAPDGAATDIVLDQAGSYSKVLCSSDFYYENNGEEIQLQLRPAAKYKFEYSLEWEAADEESGNTSSGEITFETAVANMSWYTVSEADADNKLPITVKLDKDGSTANTADLKGQTVSLSAYLRENNEDAYNKLPDGPVEFTSDNNYAQTIKVDITELKPETTYEIALGVEVDGDIIVYDDFRFTTPSANGGEEGDDKEDDRVIKVTSVEPKVSSATINYTVSGSPSNGDYDYVICYYKAKDAESWTWGDYNNWWGDDYNYSFRITGLSSATAYEYKIGFGSDYDYYTSVEELAKSVQDNFTTLADERKLSDAEAEFVESGADPKIRLKALFSGNVGQEHTYIHYFYREKAAEGTDTAWNWSNRVETSSVKQNCLQYITYGIDWGKTYEYAITLSDSYYYSNPDDVTKEGWKLTGTVEVPPATAPTAIELSETDLYLNRYSSKSIKVKKIEPADANKELVCTSSDPNVADAYYDDGKIWVYAEGVGTAKIAVKSPYSETVLAEINVEVADYVIYAKDGGTVTPADSEVWYPKYTNGKYTESQEEYLLYKVEASGATPVDNFKVTSENESIVTWNADKRKLVTGKSVGSADLVFTDADEKFEARLTVYTYAAAQKFAITGLTNYDDDDDYYYSEYDAIEKDGVYTIANDPYSSYKAVVKISPASSYDISDLSMFTWRSSNTAVATVDDGIIYPVAVGEATITAEAPTYLIDIDKNVLPPATIKIKVVDLPDTSATETTVYVLANTVTKLSEVKCPDGWEWKVPDTPIVTNAVNESPYWFEAEYTKDDKYPAESTIRVYIAQVTGMSVDGDSDAVLEVAKGSTDAENDSLTLTVYTDYRGSFDASKKENGYEDYKIEIPAVAGLSIEPVKPPYSSYDENGLYKYEGYQQFTIKAEKAGNYTLNPAISVKGKLLAKASYKLKAVEASLAESVEIQLTGDAKTNPSIKTDGYGRLYIDWTPSNEVGAAAAESVQEFDVEAILKDRKDKNAATTVTSESLKSTKVTWKVSDAKVATVKADSANSQQAKISVKGEGHTILTATVQDEAGRSAQLKIEIRNHAPRVSGSKVTVNTAFDYDSSYGLQNARNAAGSLEIIPVYGESVKTVELYDGDALSSDLKIYTSGGRVYVVGPKSAEVSAGNRTPELRVTTSTDKTYKYPLQVTVVNKPAKITAKSVNTVNLFYTNDDPVVSFNVSGTNNGISSVKWADQSSGEGNGFSTNWSGSAYGYWRGKQENISLNGNKLSDANIAKGKFTVKLNGYRDANEVSATIKWNYKKPAIITSDYYGKAAASTTIEPSAGVNGDTFYLYDKTNKRYVYYNANATSQGYYNDLICKNRNVEVGPYNTNSDRVDYWYTGSKTSGSEKIEFKLASNVWREDITVKHTIKLVKPTAALSVSQIVINTKKPATNYTRIYLKNSGYAIDLSDIKVEGDAKSTKLLEDDLLEITSYSGGYTVSVRQNDAKIMGKEPIKAGTYSYKLTPYYTDSNGSRQALNTVVLKVKVVNKDITVKTKVKNTLDLVKGTNWYNYVEITPTFSNIGTGYGVSDVKLTGEYSDYFTLDEEYDYGATGYRRLMISDWGADKLKAGQSYKLKLEYTVYMPQGDKFTVISNPITVKPKQTAPKVKVYNNNQTIYAGADVSRTYRLETDAYKYKANGRTYTYHPYEIDRVYGTLDCNKDGRADIIVSGYGDYEYYCYTDVYINDRDGVLTATGAKGKTYSVPVTVTLEGRDGISKDVKTTIKVTVKR